MTAEKVFLAEGAEYFGNRLIYRNKDVGYKSASGLSLDDHGETEYARLSAITDVVVKEVKTKTPEGKSKHKAHAEATTSDDLDELLG